LTRLVSIVWVIPLVAACETTRPPPIASAAAPAPTQSERPSPQPTASNPREHRTPNFDLAVDLDSAILQFEGQGRHALEQEAERKRASRFWPDALRSAWSRIIITAEEALDRPPGDFPRPLLIRSRIAIDTELEAAERQCGRAPDEIRSGVDHVHALLKKHLRSPDTPADEPPHAGIALAWPISSHLVTSPFGQRRDPILEEGAVRFHYGIDIAGAMGEAVIAAAPGRVSYAGWSSGGGNMVMIVHTQGYVSVYAHLDEIVVKMGAHVARGTPLGFVGNTGRSTASHLHFEVRHGGVAIDPRELLPRR
jgi:murein DD-endopeptidase MepM/ murein hydrolase activator NlpD